MEVKPGYKQTEVGVIPEDWNVRLLPEVCRFRSGRAHEQHISDTGPFICVNSKFISTDGEVRKFSTANFCPANKGDILMVMSDLPNGRALAKTYLVEADETYAVNQRVCSLTAYRDCPEFVFYVLNRNPYFLKFDNGVSQTHLLNDVFQKCPLPVPQDVDEQRAIADALSDVDGLLGGLDRLIAKKRDLQQAAIQQLLTGQKRLPGFNGEWETKRLVDIADLNRLNVVPAHSANALFTHFSLPAFDAGKIAPVELGAAIGSNKFRVPPNAVLVSKLNPRIPRIWAPDNIPTNAVASTEWLVLTPKQGIDRNFLYVICASAAFCEQMELGATGTTGSHQRISPWAALGIVISVPASGVEQAAIAEVMMEMDAELAALERRREKTRALKRAMMQELLTGKTRFVQTEAAHA